MYIITSRPRTIVFVHAPFGGVTDWYPELSGEAAIASPAGVLELDTHSSSEADPSESSLPLISVAPMVSPFLCSDDSESDTEMPERHVSPTPHDVMLTRWRSRVASRSSLPTTFTLEIPTAPFPPAPSAIVTPSTDIISPVDAPPGIRRRRAILIQPGALNMRNSVRPLPSHHLALRYTSHHLDHFTSGSSSDQPSLDHSSSGHSISAHSLSRHTSPDTTIADSSAPPRFVYPPCARALRCSEGYRRWRSAPLSTMYPPMTSESLAMDSSSESSAGLSCKRFPSHADLLPPRKRFRDSISLEDSAEEDIDADVLADIKVDATAIEVAADIDIEAEVDAGIGMEVDVEDEVEDEVESSDKGTMEVGVDMVVGINIPDGMLMPDAVERLEQRVEDIETGQREFEARSLIAGGERASLLEQVASLERSNVRLQGTMMMESARADMFRQCMSFMESELRQIRRLIVEPVIMTITRSGMTLEAIEELINQRVAEALAAYKANRAAELVVKSYSHNGDKDDNGNVGGNGNKNAGEMETETVEEMETKTEEAMGMEIPI
ncbi:hypothetical protein Tco_0889793 [Tanacetum coccineum]